MSVWAEVFLGVIAAATLATAVVQVGVIIAAGRAARRLETLVERVERELRPTFDHVNSIGRDAARATSLATAQIERVDHLFADLTRKMEETAATVQAAVVAPAREGKALLTAFRAAMDALRDARRRSRPRHRDDEDALFI